MIATEPLRRGMAFAFSAAITGAVFAASRYAGDMSDPRPASATIEDLREQIDRLDRRIVELIAERQQHVIAAGALKKDEDAVRAPARVEQVIGKVRSLAVEAGASPEVVERAYRALIDAFIELELEVSSRSE